MTVSKLLLLFARVQPSAGIKMVLHYSDELLIINKIAKSQPQWNVWYSKINTLRQGGWVKAWVYFESSPL